MVERWDDCFCKWDVCSTCGQRREILNADMTVCYFTLAKTEARMMEFEMGMAGLAEEELG